MQILHVLVQRHGQLAGRGRDAAAEVDRDAVNAATPNVDARLPKVYAGAKRMKQQKTDAAAVADDPMLDDLAFGHHSVPKLDDLTVGECDPGACPRR